MPLKLFACANCGHWQRHFAPADCPVCSDVRNDLPEDGWEFVPEPEVAARLTGHHRQLAPDLHAFSTTPRFGLDGTGWLITRPEGNIAIEAAPFYTEPMLDELQRLGGIHTLTASHVHGYGALWQLQEAFAPAVLAIHKADLNLTKAFRVTTPYDDTLDLGGDVALHNVGGHYDGQAALHDAGRGLFFCGDMFKVDQDSAGRVRSVSMHKAYHKQIPLTHAELRRYRAVVAACEFHTLLTPFEHAPDIGQAQALAALDDALAQAPGVRPFSLSPAGRGRGPRPSAWEGEGEGMPVPESPSPSPRWGEGAEKTI